MLNINNSNRLRHPNISWRNCLYFAGLTRMQLHLLNAFSCTYYVAALQMLRSKKWRQDSHIRLLYLITLPAHSLAACSFCRLLLFQCSGNIARTVLFVQVVCYGCSGRRFFKVLELGHVYIEKFKGKCIVLNLSFS